LKKGKKIKNSDLVFFFKFSFQPEKSYVSLLTSSKTLVLHKIKECDLSADFSTYNMLKRSPFNKSNVSISFSAIKNFECARAQNVLSAAQICAHFRILKN